MQRSEWMHGSLAAALAVSVLGAGVGCSHASKTGGQQHAKQTAAPLAHEQEGHGDDGREAKTEFITAAGETLEGSAEFEEVPGGVRIEVAVDNAEAGRKGVHIHEKGDCTNIAGKSMGDHLALSDQEHGLPTEPEHHLGDLGNIDIAPNGDGRLIIVVPGANLAPADTYSFAGRALVIHESEDEGTGTSGHAGKPIACAVILPQ